jgi:hypothetical protein
LVSPSPQGDHVFSEKDSTQRGPPLTEALPQGPRLRFWENPEGEHGVANYDEEQILCEFIHTENLYKIKDA